jgi:hypothetical protein
MTETPDTWGGGPAERFEALLKDFEAALTEAALMHYEATRAGDRAQTLRLRMEWLLAEQRIRAIVADARPLKRV